ncbi:MAG: TspO/MBR family protein [Novosphingobium sp.]
MTELASSGQLRAAFLRWALVLVPGMVLLGFLSSIISGSGPGSAWFDGLIKPALYPPPQTFGIVWSVLYAMMGLALAVIMSARGAWGRGQAVIAFIVQLLINLAWSPLFFAAHQITGALVVIGVLDVVVIVTIWLFWRVRPLAGVLMLPYLAWILFATLLNWQFLQANPGADGKPGAPAVQRIQL